LKRGSHSLCQCRRVDSRSICPQCIEWSSTVIRSDRRIRAIYVEDDHSCRFRSSRLQCHQCYYPLRPDSEYGQQLEVRDWISQCGWRRRIRIHIERLIRIRKSGIRASGVYGTPALISWLSFPATNPQPRKALGLAHVTGLEERHPWGIYDESIQNCHDQLCCGADVKSEFMAIHLFRSLIKCVICRRRPPLTANGFRKVMYAAPRPACVGEISELGVLYHVTDLLTFAFAPTAIVPLQRRSKHLP